jgi:hypothetical protein
VFKWDKSSMTGRHLPITTTKSLAKDISLTNFSGSGPIPGDCSLRENLMLDAFRWIPALQVIFAQEKETGTHRA